MLNLNRYGIMTLIQWRSMNKQNRIEIHPLLMEIEGQITAGR